MGKRVAYLLSVLLHPLLMPTYAVIYLFSVPAYFSQTLTRGAKFTISGFIFSLTFIIPVLSVLFLYRLKIIKSLQLWMREDRVFILLLNSVLLYLTFYFLRELEISDIFNIFLFCSFITAFVAFLLTLFYKISLHLIGVGGFCGSIVMLITYFGINAIPELIISIILSGLVASARLRLGAHTIPQIYTGFLIGFLIFILVFVLSV